MKTTLGVSLRLLLPLGVCGACGCSLIRPHRPAAAAPAATAAGAGLRGIAPSPRLLVGRVFAIDPRRQFAFIDVGTDAPAPATAEGAELTSRTLDLRETAQLRVSRYRRGQTLGTTVISGQPSPGDEVVWLAP